MIDETEKAYSAASERRNVRWDIRNAPGNYLSLLLTQAGSAFFSFAAVWLISRAIGSEGYGGIIAIIAASQVAQIFVNWSCVSVVRFGTEEFIETARIARIFWLRFFILLINFGFIVLASGLWFPWLAGWLALSPQSFWLVILHFASTVLWIHVQFALQGAKLPRIQGLLQMIERLLIFAGVAGLLAIGWMSPFAALVCYAIAPLMTAFTGTFYLRSLIFAPFNIDRQFLKKILAYSLPLLPFSLVGYFSGSYLDAIFVSKFLSTRDLGVYSVATQINGIALQFPTLANSLLLPMFVTLQKKLAGDELDNYFRHVVPSLTLLWGIACCIVSFTCFFAIPFVFGEEFKGAVFPLWILLSSTAVALPAGIGYSALSHASSRTYISMFAAIFSAAVNIAGNVLLIPRYGLIGCAWATLIAISISVVTFVLLLRRACDIPVSWVVWAIIPAVSGAAVLTVSLSAWGSLVVCLALGFVIGLFHKHSLKQTCSIIKNIWS